MNKKLFGAIALVLVWALLTAFAWFGPTKENSLSERRPLAQMPELSMENLFGGKFMSEFEEYTLDQFPLRETFRSIKALTHYYALGQQDNNGIYIANGHVAELAFPLDTGSVNHALQQFQTVYDLHLQESGNIYTTVVPDKGYYLAEENGYPSLDYEALFSMVEEGMPWAEYIDLTGALTLEDYYRTDTHWRQENLSGVVETLTAAMGAEVSGTYTQTALERPFYGVYYGQAAVPMEPDTMVLLENDVLADCTVFNYTTGRTTPVYDMAFYDSDDLYQIYLSGAQSLLRIENPNGKTDRELIIFRDSYGSALAPLLLEEYAAVTLVDIRYIMPQVLGNFVEFEGKDVLFMYSSLVLNKNLI